MKTLKPEGEWFVLASESPIDAYHLGRVHGMAESWGANGCQIKTKIDGVIELYVRTEFIVFALCCFAEASPTELYNLRQRAAVPPK